MGIIRKLISGSLAAGTGGASLAVVQFRSDTERGTRQTKKLRQELAGQGQDGSSSVETPETPVASPREPVFRPSLIQGVTAQHILSGEVSLAPENMLPGWKLLPHDEGLEGFWDGVKWTSLTRPKT